MHGAPQQIPIPKEVFVKKRRHSKPVIAACALFLALAAPPLHASDLKSGVHIGEDNTQYPLAVSTDKKAPFQGRVAPQVLAESKARDHVNVIIFLKSKDLGGVSKEAATAFSKKIDTLSGEIRFIHRKYNPSESLPPARKKQRTNRSRIL